MTVRARPAPTLARRPILARHPMLMGLIAILAGFETLHAAMVAYTARPTMGDLGAGPEEFSLVASLYAVVAIGLIAQHRWLIERAGWRRFVQASAALVAAGAIVCASAHTLPGFAAGRVLMALGGASFLTAARVLINRLPAALRFAGIKRLAAGVASGLLLGPLLAGSALSLESWRLVYVVLLALAVVIGVGSKLLDAQVPPPAIRSESKPTGLIALMVLSFGLLYALQRAQFVGLGELAPFEGLIVFCAAPLAGLVWLEWRRARPLIRLADLTQRRYLFGLLMFAAIYGVIGAMNCVMPILLTQGMGLPLEDIGRYLSLGALGSLAAWFVVTRLLPRYPAPAPYFAAGLAALAAGAWSLSRLSENAAPLASVVPALLGVSAFALTAFPVTAMQTFRDLQADETTLSHANQVKNIVAQLMTAAGISIATLLLQWRSTLHYTQLAESLNPNNLALSRTLGALSDAMAGPNAGDLGARLALEQLGRIVSQQSVFMGTLDFFTLVAAPAALGALVAAGIGVAKHFTVVR